MAHPLYFIETSHRRGNAFRELDRDDNSKQAVIALIRSGEIDRDTVLKVLEVNEDEGTVRNVTEEVLEAAAFDIEPDPVDLRSLAWDRARDLRKEMV